MGSGEGRWERPSAPLLPPSGVMLSSACERVPSEVLRLGQFVGLELVPVMPSQPSTGCPPACRLPMCTMHDRGAAAVQCWGKDVGSPPPAPLRMSAPHPNRPTALLALLHLPVAGTGSPREDAFRASGFPRPHPPPAHGPSTGQEGQGAGGTDLPEGSLAVAAHPPELLELLVPAAGSRPSPRNAGVRETVATGSESEGLIAGFVCNTHQAPCTLCFRRPVSRETKAPVFFREHKTGFFLSPSSRHPRAGPHSLGEEGSHLGPRMERGSESRPYLRSPVCTWGERGPCEGLVAMGWWGRASLMCLVHIALC